MTPGLELLDDRVELGPGVRVAQLAHLVRPGDSSAPIVPMHSTRFHLSVAITASLRRRAACPRFERPVSPPTPPSPTSDDLDTTSPSASRVTSTEPGSRLGGRPDHIAGAVTGDRVAPLELALIVVGAEQPSPLGHPQLLHPQPAIGQRGQPLRA